VAGWCYLPLVVMAGHKCCAIEGVWPPNIRFQPTPDTHAFWEWYLAWLSSWLTGNLRARLKRLPLAALEDTHEDARASIRCSDCG
jgi:hypothetical protein